MYIAHYNHKEDWEPHYLSDHVNEMLSLLDRFELSFDPYNMTRSCIMLHDIGKKSNRFQSYVKDPRGKRGSIKHAQGGAYALYIKSRQDDDDDKSFLIELVCNIVAGHHKGLSNHDKNFFDSLLNLPNELADIEKLSEEEVTTVLSIIDSNYLTDILNESNLNTINIYLATLVRFVMSALVDADYISTEAYFSNFKADNRIYEQPTYNDFQIKLDDYMASDFPDQRNDSLDGLKQDVQMQSVSAGHLKGSMFTLHAPTGTGKTLAALKFAINHAIKFNKKRIITALPLTNLTEEISSIYRAIFGDNHVIEDHSKQIFTHSEYDPIRLATENWNRSFVVTTTVQLFESLFNQKPAKLRKLHRIADSIIILDEYHKLPHHVLEPILQQLDILQTYFNVTVLLMSATPFPLLESREIQQIELQNSPTEITDYNELFLRTPKRVKYEWIKNSQSIEDIANQLTEEVSALAIVNTRKEAQHLHRTLTNKKHNYEAIYFVASTLCGIDREKVIKEIKQKRNAGEPIAVISTSILEAGIDVSFPVVYRTLAPLESIVQAAGRCNRYNNDKQEGVVKIFEFIDSSKKDDVFQMEIEQTKHLLNTKGPDSFMEPQSFVTYFKRMFSSEKLNKADIKAEDALDFQKVSERFRLIEDNQTTVICSKIKGFNEKWLDEIKSPAWWRKVQPYSLSVPSYIKFEQMNGVNILKQEYSQPYGINLLREVTK